MWASAKLFFRGPVWIAAGVVSAAATLIGVLGDAFWTWLSLGLASLVLAAFFSFHRSQVEAATERESLPTQIDDLHREGIELVGELSTPIEPKNINGTWELSLDAPNERWDKAERFDERIRELLIAGYPALLSDYAKGFNEFRREQRQRESSREPNPAEDKRSDAEKLREFADRQHRRPAQVLEASLDGLARARHRLG